MGQATRKTAKRLTATRSTSRQAHRTQAALIRRIEERRKRIYARRGTLSDSVALVRQARDER